MKLLRRYKKKLERRFSRRVKREGFNFQCDVGLANRVRIAAELLEVPIYVLMEEITELGLSDVGEIVRDHALTEQLQRHLLSDHLLVDRLDPESDTVSNRSLRLRNAMKLLELYEIVGVSLRDIMKALNSVGAGARSRDDQETEEKNPRDIG